MSPPRVLSVATFATLVLALILHTSGAVTAQEGEPFTTVLQPGYNMAGWIEPESGVAELFEAIPELEAVYAWDAGEQRYRSSWAQREGDLTTLMPGVGLWLKIGGDEPVTWTRSGDPDPAAGLTSLREGWNLVAWAGWPGAGLGEAVAGLGSGLEAALTWDAEGKRFRYYVPEAEELTGPVPILSRGDALWLYSSGGQYWLQPSTPDLQGLRTVHVTVRGPDGQPFWEWDGHPLETGAYYHDFETGEDFYSPNVDLAERGGALLLADGAYGVSVTANCGGLLAWYTEDGSFSGRVGQDDLVVAGEGVSATINLGGWPNELNIHCHTGARYQIAGTVVDEAGAVRTDYEIRAHPEEDVAGFLSTRTDDSGAFTLGAPDGHAYHLTVNDACGRYLGWYSEDEGLVGIQLGEGLWGLMGDGREWTVISVDGADVTGIEIVIPSSVIADRC